MAGTVVQLSFLSRPVCLPVLARLWRSRHTGKMAHARELAELIAARYPDRIVHVVGDAAYVGERLRTLDDRITWTSRLKLASVLHQLPRRAPDARGGRAAEARWRATRVRRYERTDTVHTARFAAEPCGTFWFATMSLRLAAVTIAVMGLPLVTTDLDLPRKTW